jgi:hypothetical protein
MPEVQVTTTVDIDQYVDVDIEDILDECSEKELEAVVDYLVDNEIIKANRILPKYISLSEEEFNKNVEKLSELYLVLSNEESAIIDSILKRY